MHDNIPTPPFRSHGATYHTDRTRKFLVSVPIHNTGSFERKGVYLDKDADEYAEYIFKLPEDFVSIVGCKIVLQKEGVFAGDVVISLSALAGESGESYVSEAHFDSNNIITISDGTQVLFAADHATLFTDVTKDHYIYFKITRNATNASDDLDNDVAINGVEIEYTADM